LTTLTDKRIAEREAALDAAIGEGRIDADQRDEYARLYDANPRAIGDLLTGRAERGRLMPVGERS
jgi:hypothetical protein